MKRYTATFSNPGGITELRRSLDKQLYRDLPVYTLGEEASPEPGLWQIELGSDAPQGHVRRALQRFGEGIGGNLIQMSWGWSLSRPQPGGCAPQLPGSLHRQYRVPLPRVWFTLGIYLSGILVWGWALLFGWSDGDRLLSVLVLLVAWSFAMTYVQGTLTLVSWLELDEEGLEVGYWLPPWRRFLDWGEVDYLLVRPSGGCLVGGAGKRLELPLKVLAGWEESRCLLRAVVCRAGLVLAEDQALGGATYRRPAAV